MNEEERPYEILQQWGIHRDEVRFFLRHESTIPGVQDDGMSSRAFYKFSPNNPEFKICLKIFQIILIFIIIIIIIILIVWRSTKSIYIYYIFSIYLYIQATTPVFLHVVSF